MQSYKSHIVFLTPGFAESENDSTTIPAMQIYLKCLRKVRPDIQITLISFQFPFTKKTFDWHGIKVIPLNGGNKRFKKLLVWHKALKLLNKLHSKNPISNIHSFWIGECSFIGNRFSTKHNIKHIVTTMGQDVNYGNRYIKSVKNKNTKVITLSKNQYSLLHKNYGITSKIIPWFLEDKLFPKPQESDIDVLGVGALNKIKNYDLFISIVSNLVKTHPKLKAEIIGEGLQRKKLEYKIEALGLKKNISLIGKLPRQTVIEKMAKSKILLHTSDYESFGFVFLEALQTGMSIVSKNVGIAKENSKWAVSNTQQELTDSCLKFLELTNKKSRINLTSETESISAYLKLYNA